MSLFLPILAAPQQIVATYLDIPNICATARVSRGLAGEVQHRMRGAQIPGRAKPARCVAQVDADGGLWNWGVTLTIALGIAMKSQPAWQTRVAAGGVDRQIGAQFLRANRLSAAEPANRVLILFATALAP
jgi:hypothetical protein